MKIKIKLISLALTVALMLSLVSCTFLLELPGVSDGTSGTGDPGGEVTFPEGEEKPPEGWDGEAFTKTGVIPVYLMKSESANLVEFLDTGAPKEAVFESRCEEIASLSGAVVTGESVGRTEIYMKVGDECLATFSVTVEFMISTSGYDFTSDLKDGEYHKVQSNYEANRILDLAIAHRYHSFCIDFSGISESFKVNEDFELDIELGSHAKLKILYYEDTAHRAEFEISYLAEAASETTPLTEKNTYLPAQSANMIARRAFAEAAGVARADNFNDFAIYKSNLESFEVYNSEELWWAVEQGYLPVFPMANTKAELFFERAKMILRDIVNDSMTDTEKVIAIYEYLVDGISYDYDAFDKSTKVNSEGNADAIYELKKDTCYYLEGVFEKGRAVCDGKTKAFVLLCGIEGIRTLRVSGSSLSGGVGHAWNYVNLNGGWYLVDTTSGDERYTADSGIAAFFGSAVEAVGYGAFLKPLDYHKSEYSYGGVWSEIEKSPAPAPFDYFDMNLKGSEYDFILDSRAEAKAIFDKAVAFGIDGRFMLTFIPADDSNVFGYFDGIRKDLKANIQIFTVIYGDEKVYIALLDK
ncbi:MAG: transglutaminase domain-containing protein [Clostridia bacterium]|nr:transglutaminase domain-containing protein [Clostridia bacterium]